MSKLQRILVGVLAVQLVIVAFVFWPRSNASGATKPLLSEIKADDITSLTIHDNQGATVKLTKQGAAGQTSWVLADAGDFPADTAKITPVLTKLAELKSDRPVAQTQASFKRLQVADDTFQRRLDIETSGGANRTLFVGSSGGGQSAYVRVGDQNDVYLVTGFAAWDFNATPASWIDTAYMKVAAADVLGLTLSNANGQFSFSKDDKGAWTMNGLTAPNQLDANQITALVNEVTSLQMTQPLGKTEDTSYGLAQPLALVTLKAKSADAEKTITLSIGAKDATDNTYVVKSSESPYYVRVAESGVKDLVEKKQEGFLQPTPTPAAAVPTATPTP